MAREQAMIAAGVGCRREITADEIEKAVRMALGLYGLAPERLEIVATERGKASDPAFAEAARRLAATLRPCSTEELDRIAGRILTPSQLVLESKGVPSIAEGAALVAAGRNSRLLGARVVLGRATCAIAVGDGP
jgi:cobalt-precorrin 5A hydrolase